MKKGYFFSIIIFLVLIVAAVITSGGKMGYFLNLPSFLMVTLITLTLLRGSFSFREMGKYFKIAFEDSIEAPRGEIKNGIQFFRIMQIYLIVSGFLGTVIGAMAMLSALEMSVRVGFGASLALLTLLYGIIFTLLIPVPFRSGLEKRLNKLDG
ncbi:MAG: MotA/TolQ/ExbB proton channel family protein [Spirochaetia bacterium]